MTKDRMMELAAAAQLGSIVGGKLDAYYAPPAAIQKFAELIIDETIKELANVEKR